METDRNTATASGGSGGLVETSDLHNGYLTHWELWQNLLGVNYASLESTRFVLHVFSRREAEKQLAYQNGVRARQVS